MQKILSSIPVIILLALAHPALAQLIPPDFDPWVEDPAVGRGEVIHYYRIPVDIDTGTLANYTDEPKVVYEQTLHVADVFAGFSVCFDLYSLAPGSKVRFTILETAYTPRFQAGKWKGVKKTPEGWVVEHTSVPPGTYSRCMLRELAAESSVPGWKAKMQLIAAPQTSKNRLSIPFLTVTHPDQWGAREFIRKYREQQRRKGLDERGTLTLPTPSSPLTKGIGLEGQVCGLVDDRECRRNRAIGRLVVERLSLPLRRICTAFIVDCPSTTSAKCLMSAKHCFADFPDAGPPESAFIEFEVQDSMENCAFVLSNPPAPNRFEIDLATVRCPDGTGAVNCQVFKGDFDNDWAVFNAYHAESQKTPFEEQGESFQVGTVPSAGEARITGYGRDGGGNCECNMQTGGEKNHTLQSDTGIYALSQHVEHQIDICSGSSGAPIVYMEPDPDSVGRVLGIATANGCQGDDPESGVNEGTRTTLSLLSSALRTCSDVPGFQVNTTPNTMPPHAEAAMRSDSAFLVSWAEDARRVRGRLVERSGQPLGEDFVVNTTAAGPDDQLTDISLAASDSNFVVTWSHCVNVGIANVIRARVYDSAGLPQGSDFRVKNTSQSQNASEVAVMPDGEFVIVWHEGTSDHEVRARHFSSSGIPLADDFRVNANNSGFHAYPSIATTDTGDFIVVWQHNHAGGQDILRRRFASDGTPITNDTIVVAGSNLLPDVAVGAGDDFVVAWQNSADEIRAQRFSSMGDPVGGNLRVVEGVPPTTLSRHAAAMGANGQFSISWEDGIRLFDADNNIIREGLLPDGFFSTAANPASDFLMLFRLHVDNVITGHRFNRSRCASNGTTSLGSSCGPMIFADGFEKGDTSAWSDVVGES